MFVSYVVWQQTSLLLARHALGRERSGCVGLALAWRQLMMLADTTL